MTCWHQDERAALASMAPEQRVGFIFARGYSHATAAYVAERGPVTDRCELCAEDESRRCVAHGNLGSCPWGCGASTDVVARQGQTHAAGTAGDRGAGVAVTRPVARPVADVVAQVVARLESNARPDHALDDEAVTAALAELRGTSLDDRGDGADRIGPGRARVVVHEEWRTDDRAEAERRAAALGGAVDDGQSFHASDDAWLAVVERATHGGRVIERDGLRYVLAPSGVAAHEAGEAVDPRHVVRHRVGYGVRLPNGRLHAEPVTREVDVPHRAHAEFFLPALEWVLRGETKVERDLLFAAFTAEMTGVVATAPGARWAVSRRERDALRMRRRPLAEPDLPVDKMRALLWYLAAHGATPLLALCEALDETPKAVRDLAAVGGATVTADGLVELPPQPGEQIKRLLARGATVLQLAEHFNMTPKQVRSAVLETGGRVLPDGAVDPPPRADPVAPRSVREAIAAAGKLGTTPVFIPQRD